MFQTTSNQGNVISVLKCRHRLTLSETLIPEGLWKLVPIFTYVDTGGTGTIWVKDDEDREIFYYDVSDGFTQFYTKTFDFSLIQQTDLFFYSDGTYKIGQDCNILNPMYFDFLLLRVG